MTMKKELLSLRKSIKSRKPKFVRQGTTKLKRLQGSIRWRKPHGYHSKLMKGSGHKKMVSPGYGSPSEVKGLDRSGLEIVLVSKLDQLGSVKPKEQGIIISAKLGTKKKLEIMTKAVEMKLTILNIKDPQAYAAEKKQKLQKKKEVKEQKVEEKKKETKKEEKESIEDKLSDEEKKKLEKQEIDRLLTKKF